MSIPEPQSVSLHFSFSDHHVGPSSALKAGDAIWERTPTRIRDPASPSLPKSSIPLPSPPSPFPAADPINTTPHALRYTAEFQRICDVDNQRHQYHLEVITSISRLAKDGPDGERALVVRAHIICDHLKYLLTTIEDLHFDSGPSGVSLACTKKKVTENLISLMESLLDITTRLQARQSVLVDNHPRQLDLTADSFTHAGLNDHNPAVLLAAFIAVVLNMYGRLTHVWSSLTLKLLTLLLRVTVSPKHEPRNCPPVWDEYFLKYFPKNIASAKKVFGMSADIVIWAACPKCKTTYSPEEYARTCSAKRFNQKCGAELCNTKSENGESVLKPILPFPVQDLDSFVASLLARPGMEELLEMGLSYALQSRREFLLHMQDGSIMKEVKDINGRPFVDGLPRKDLHLLWSGSTDWYNPYFNKAAGKKASVGAIAFTLLNLPPSLQFDPAFMYLAAVIPEDPPEEFSNEYHKPVIQMFRRSYEMGTIFKPTIAHTNGRKSRSAIAVEVLDTPARAKVMGTKSHSGGKLFCAICALLKRDINNLDWNTWPQRDIETWRAHAAAWRDAPSKTARKRLFDENCVRWSPFLELPYFNPITMLSIDPMHTLFLRIVQEFFRNRVGVTEEARAAAPPKDADLVRAIELFMRPDISATKLNKTIRHPTLLHLCRIHNLSIGFAKQARKSDMINELQKVLVHVSPASADRSMVATSDTSDIIGPDFVDDIAFTSKKFSEETAHRRVADALERAKAEAARAPITFHSDFFTKHELSTLRENIKNTIHPSWHRPPPTNIGSASTGKLKAEEWRSGIEFYLVVEIARHYSPEKCSYQAGSPEFERRVKLFESAMSLALAIRWATSYRTSVQHASKYMAYMYRHLKLILELHPDRQLSPVDHMALHIGQLLLRFGPVPGWWMFPFERLIGRLQKTNINYRRGELETTTLKAFCEASRLRAYLYRSDCAEVLKEALPYLDEIWRKEGFSLEGEKKPAPKFPSDEPIPLSLRQSLVSANKKLQSSDAPTLPLTGVSTPSIIINSVSFSVWTRHKGNAMVYFHPIGSGNFVPGRIEYIRSCSTGAQWLAIKRLKPLSIDVPNPFGRYSEFGAELWSAEYEHDAEIIPSTQPLCHSISQPWSKGVLVMKCLDRNL